MLKSLAAATSLAVALGMTAPASAQAVPTRALRCPEPMTYYKIVQAKVSSRPTNVKSAYITGPATISYTKTVSAQVSLAISGSATSEANVILAKASATLGVTLTGSRTWQDGFTYAKPVPKGQRRALQLFQTSRSFVAQKYRLIPQTCNYRLVSSSSVNAPLKSRQDEWKLVK